MIVSSELPGTQETNKQPSLQQFFLYILNVPLISIKNFWDPMYYLKKTTHIFEEMNVNILNIGRKNYVG